MHLPILKRRQSNRPPEYSGERTLIVVSASVRDLGHEDGAFAEGLRSVLDSCLGDELAGGDAEDRAQPAVELVDRHSRDPGQIFNPEFSV